MPSESSPSERRRYFYPTLYGKNLRRFWPVWGCYLVLWLFLMPLAILANRAYSSTAWPSNQILSLLQAGAIFAALFGLAAAMAVFSYLYNARSVGMIHALPVTRDGLFWTNWLSGFSFLALPNLVIFLLTLLAEALVRRVQIWPLVLWLLSMTLMCLFFYSFAGFCAMFTGHILALPAFYFILNFLVAAMASVFQQLAESFLYGYNGVVGLDEAVRWFTPIVKLSTGVSYISQEDAGPLRGFEYILLYAAVGVVMTGLALLVYRRRHLESAGDIVSVSWVKPVFKYGVALCSAVAVGTFLYSFLLGRPDSALGLSAFMLLWGVVGYFLAEMLLRKSFWVFRRSWKGAVAFAGVLVVCCCALEFDLTGFETRIPDPSRVQSITLSSIGSAPYDSGDSALKLTEPEQIAQFTAVHAALLQERGNEANEYWRTQEDSGLEVETANTVYINVTYDLAFGGTMRRSYHLLVREEDLGRSDSAAARLTALLNRPELVEQAYFWNRAEGGELVRASVNVYSRREGTFEDVVLSGEDLSGLWEAVQSDMEAGRLGRRFLLSNQERLETCYYNDLVLTFYYTYTRPDGSRGTDAYDLAVTLQTTAEETLKELERLGIRGMLITHAEYQRRSQGYAQWGDHVYGELEDESGDPDAELVPQSVDEPFYDPYRS